MSLGEQSSTCGASTLFVPRALRRERKCSRSGERAGERGKDAEVGVKRDLLDATDAERRESGLVLQASEGALDGAASTVEVAEPLALVGDQRVQAGNTVCPCRSAQLSPVAEPRHTPLYGADTEPTSRGRVADTDLSDL